MARQTLNNKPTQGNAAQRKNATKSKHTHSYIILFLAVFCFILYGNTITNDYSLDDELVTWTNPQVSKGIKALPEIFTTFYYQASGNVGTIAFGYRPLAKATFAIERSIFGVNPQVSHFINILLYIATAWLLYLILRRLFKKFHWIFPLAITLIFLAHPLHTEVVASLKNREELLAFLGALGGMWFFLEYAGSGKTKHILWGTLCFLLGYISKSSVMPFLLIYPLTLYFFTDVKPRRLISITIVSLFVLIVAQVGPMLFLPEAIHSNALIENPLYLEKNIMARAATGFVGLLHYLKLLFWPSPLLFYYGYDMIPVTNFANPLAIISFIIHLTLFLLAIVLFRKKHVLSYAILFYLISIAMYSNIVVPVVGIVGDRFAYVASLGFAIAIGWLIFRLVQGKSQPSMANVQPSVPIIILLMLIIVPYTIVTIDRNKDWKNLTTLYEADIPHLERSVKANTQYAGNLMYNAFNAAQQEGRLPSRLDIERMIKHYNLSLKILPDYYDALNGLGTVYSNFLGDYKRAIQYFEAAARSNPKNVAAYINLGYVYRELKNNEKALECYHKVLSMDSTKVKAYFKLADIYFEIGDTAKATRMNMLATRFDPYTNVPYVNIGNYHLLSRDTLGAVKWYEKAVEIQPDYELCMKLYMHYSQQGDFQKANYYKQMAEQARQLTKQKPR